MCGQDFRIHHWFAEELAWAPCITCQSCQAYCLPRFIIALVLCCQSPLCACLSPARNYARLKKRILHHAPQCQPWSPATKLGYTVGLLKIRKRSGQSGDCWECSQRQAILPPSSYPFTPPSLCDIAVSAFLSGVKKSLKTIRLIKQHLAPVALKKTIWLLMSLWLAVVCASFTAWTQKTPWEPFFTSPLQRRLDQQC